MRELQKCQLLRAVRFLSQKLVRPSPLERQNVQKAVDIFSWEMIAGLETHFIQGTAGFHDIQETLEFMKMWKTWWDIHDIGSISQWWRKRQPNKRPFNSPVDDQLHWLEETSLPWLQD